MKKLLVFAFVLSCSVFCIFANNSTNNETSEKINAEVDKSIEELGKLGKKGGKFLKDTGKSIANSGKKLGKEIKDSEIAESVKETGKSIADSGKKLGKEIKNSEIAESVKETVGQFYEEISTPVCYGKWTCKNGKSKTVIQCDKTGTMKVTQKTGGKTRMWLGSFSATNHTITFRITKVGGKDGEQTGTWVMAYSVQNDGNVMKLSSINIPNDDDGTNFKLGAVFVK